MSVFRPIQEAFTAGEISPRFRAQQSSELYQQGLQRCENMVPLSQGPVASRPGMEYIATVEPAAGETVTNARIFAIEQNSDELAIAVMGGGQVQVVSDASFVNTHQYVVNPHFDDGLQGWDVVIQGDSFVITSDFAGNPTAFMRSNAPQPSSARLRQEFEVDDAPDSLTFNFTLQGTQPVVYASISFTDYGVDTVYEERFIRVFPDTGIVQVSVDLPGGAGYTGPVFIEFHVQSNEPEGALTNSSSHADICEVIGTFPPIGEQAPLPIPYSDEELEVIQAIQNPYVLSVFFVHPDHPPQELVLDAGLWVFQEITFDISGTAPDWGEDQGWPRAVGSFQGRVVFAGTFLHPQTVWTSVVGDWYDVSAAPSEPVVTDALQFTITDIGAIQWVQGQKFLLLGTTNGEHSVTATGPLVSVEDIAVHRQSSYGSKHLQPAVAGEEVFYVSGDGRKLRATNFDRDIQGWKSIDLTWPSEHITGDGIRRLVFARDPYQIAWCVRVDGTMAAMTYEPGLQLIGWTRHSTAGQFIDAASAKLGGVDYSIFIVRRQIDNETRYYVEAIHDVTAPLVDVTHLDSHLRQTLADGVTIVPGLEHLEGSVVSVIADGLPLDDQFTVVGGQIVLPEHAADVVVGLPYTAMIETLPATSPPNVGGLAAMKSWAEIGVRLLSADPPLVNGIRQDVGEADAIMVELGWNLYATIVVEQDLPVSLAVTGIYGRLSTEDIIG